MTDTTPAQILARAQVPAANGRPVRKDEIELHDRGLYIESWLPERRSRRKPLLFVHGELAGSWLWERYLAYFASRGWEGHALNLQNHHWSRTADPNELTFDSYVDDVVAALNGVAAYDWAGFLHAHVDSLDPPLLDGLQASGWKLVYTDQKSDYEQQYDAHEQSSRHLYNYAWSIGLTLNKATINDVLWDGPAFKVGISPGATIVAVNGQEFSTEVLDDAIAAAKTGRDPIRLTLKYQGAVREVALDYHGGLQYPHLVRIEGTPDTLSELIAPRK